eukprot:3722434-Amphidinium_carterae.1
MSYQKEDSLCHGSAFCHGDGPVSQAGAMRACGSLGRHHTTSLLKPLRAYNAVLCTARLVRNVDIPFARSLQYW